MPQQYKEILKKAKVKILSYPILISLLDQLNILLFKIIREEFSPTEFERFIIKNFDAPDEIWRHAYEQQINNFDRFLLNTMLSFGNSVNIHELELAFNSRLDYEVENNNYIKNP